MPTVKEIEAALFELAPREGTMDWDNVGHLLGDPSQKVARCMVALDITHAVAEEAIAGLVPEDSIALSGYKMDIHNGTNCTTVFQTIDKPFGVPYGCLVSKERSNLMFAGRCASTDARVIGSTRVMSVCMAMGQAAGVGAALAVDESTIPENVDVQKIRRILLEQGAILSMGQ